MSFYTVKNKEKGDTVLKIFKNREMYLKSFSGSAYGNRSLQPLELRNGRGIGVSVVTERRQWRLAWQLISRWRPVPHL